jgi:carboxylate-amine ligase
MDLLRDDAGKWLVLEDNLRVPSGIGYAVHNREVMRTAVPELAALADRHGAAPVDGVVAMLREALLDAAPTGVGEPSLAVLSAGPSDSAWFEHRLLAERLGVPLVTPGELAADPVTGRVVAATEDGPLPLDVVYRRMDEDELAGAPAADGAPALELLAAAARAGLLGLANALGTGVADDKAVYASVPRMIEFYLGERPILANVPTWLLADDEVRGELLDRLDELVVKPVDGYGGRGVTFGATLTTAALARLRDRIEQAPERWVAQEPVHFSTHSTWAGGETFEPRHVDLRTFTFSGGRTQTAPVALTRVAPPGSRVVNSSRGGGTKDTWLMPSAVVLP